VFFVRTRYTPGRHGILNERKMYRTMAYGFNLEKAVYPRTARKKKRTNSNTCRCLRFHPMGDVPNLFNLLICQVTFVFFEDEKRFFRVIQLGWHD
jgi:hypothetical protein